MTAMRCIRLIWFHATNNYKTRHRRKPIKSSNGYDVGMLFFVCYAVLLRARHCSTRTGRTPAHFASI
jgi:hypothetical protein